MELRSKNLLVTGGAGFIGSNFIKYLINKFPQVKIYNIDKLTYASNIDFLESLKNNPNYKFIEGDICNQFLVKNIFEDFNIDGVINFAAETHVDNSIQNPTPFINTNINGTYNLLKQCYNFWMDSPKQTKKMYNHARFHQISTDEVYGSIINGSFDENSPYNPSSPYSASKASADMLTKSFNITLGLNTTILTALTILALIKIQKNSFLK